ncbi:hypothetical protein Ddye_019744 [Dipteronia dyeriana]|uniref:Uncharacterized protein n=1 Tax=Dipteronia dyeriana TaxID=168575 RepID=A0AAD9WUQ8_9ROSI|nr:hypothetical protein Ddye_019744 [Dipteronia dyeriana]
MAMKATKIEMMVKEERRGEEIVGIIPTIKIPVWGSVGTNAFTTPLAQYKAHDDHLGLRRRRRSNVSYSEDDDQHQLNRHLQLTPLMKTLSPKFSLISKFLKSISFRGPMLYQIYENFKQRITPFCLLLDDTHIDVQEGNIHDEEVHGKRKGCSQKMDFEWIFIITNIVLESMSAIFTQLSSKQKPQYALFGTCLIQIIYEGHRHQQIPAWRRRGGTWYYYRRQRGKSLATLNNIVALACALGQCVVLIIDYSFESPIKLTVTPIILANGVLIAKFLTYRKRSTLYFS